MALPLLRAKMARRMATLHAKHPTYSQAILASLIETCKLEGIDPRAYLVDILARIARGHTIIRLDRLLRWNWKTGQIGESREPQRKVKFAVAVPAR